MKQHSILSLGWISKLVWIQFNSSFMQCHLMFSFKWNLIFIKSIHFFDYLISWSSLEVCGSMELKCKWINLNLQWSVCVLNFEFDPPCNKDDGSVCFQCEVSGAKNEFSSSNVCTLHTHTHTNWQQILRTFSFLFPFVGGSWSDSKRGFVFWYQPKKSEGSTRTPCLWGKIFGLIQAYSHFIYF